MPIQEPVKSEWWHLADALTRQDELLAQILKAIQLTGPAPPSEEYVARDPASMVVGATVKEIVDPNPKRAWMLITNASETVCYIGLRESVTTTTGVQLNQNDVFVIDRDNPYMGDIYAITASGTADLRIMEVSRV